MQGVNTQSRGTANSESLRATVVGTIDRERHALITLSRFIHRHPEIAMQEVTSSEACAAFLEKHEFTVERGISGRET